MAADNIFCQHTLTNWPPSFAVTSLPYNISSMATNNYLSVHDLASLGLNLHGDVKYLMQPPFVPPEAYLSQQQQLELLAYSVATSSNNNAVRWRDPASAPFRKLSVDLIRTYKRINEVGQ